VQDYLFSSCRYPLEFVFCYSIPADSVNDSIRVFMPPEATKGCPAFFFVCATQRIPSKMVTS